MKIKETHKYSLSFFSNGNTCELSSFENRVYPYVIRLPLNIEEAIKLHEALEKWLKKRMEK